MEDDDWEEWNGRDPFWVHATAGSFAGVAEHTVMFPVDTVKTFTQAENGGGLAEVRALVRREGVMRLWRGATSMLYGCGPAHAAYFSLYEWGKIAFGADGPEIAPARAAAVGAVATLAHDAIMTPADAIKQRMQLGYHASVGDALRTLMRTEGVRVLYRAYPTVVAMNIPSAAFTVGANETLKRLLNPSGEYHAGFSLVSGFVAGAVAGFLTTPLDRVRTLLQTQHLAPADGVLNAECAKPSSVECAPRVAPAAVVTTTASTAATPGRRRARHFATPPGMVVPSVSASTSTSSVSASTSTTRSPHAAFLMARKFTGRLSLTASALASPLVPFTSNGWGAPSTSFVGGFAPQSARPKYTKPLRCPLPIAMWASPGTSTLVMPPVATVVPAPPPHEYRGAFDVARTVMKREGLSGFFRGASQRMAVQAPGVAVSWTAYETAKEALLHASGYRD